jgi:hypothetical protein
VSDAVKDFITGKVLDALIKVTNLEEAMREMKVSFEEGVGKIQGAQSVDREDSRSSFHQGIDF